MADSAFVTAGCGLPAAAGHAVGFLSGVQRSTVVVQYLKDPLVYHGKVSTRLVRELLRQVEEVSARFDEIRLPLLVMHGADDRMTDPQGSRTLYTQVSAEDKTLKIYDGLYHEIFHEPVRQEIFAEMSTWLTQRLAAG